MGACCTVNNQNIINPVSFTMQGTLDYIPKTRNAVKDSFKNEELLAYQKERWGEIRNHQKLSKSVVRNFGKLVKRNLSRKAPYRKEKIHSNMMQSSALGSETMNDKRTGSEDKNEWNTDTQRGLPFRTSRKTETGSKAIKPIEENADESSKKRSSIITGTALATRNSLVDAALFMENKRESQVKKETMPDFLLDLENSGERRISPKQMQRTRSEERVKVNCKERKSLPIHPGLLANAFPSRSFLL